MASNYPKLATFCLNVVREFAAVPIDWDEFKLYRDMWSSALVSRVNPQTRYNENGNVVSVIALKNGYFLHMNMSFDYPKKDKLQAISIHFYDNEGQLLRVDWAYQELMRNKHAQPHWHVNTRLQKNHNGEPTTYSFKEYMTFQNFQQEEEDQKIGLDLSRMHLYMTYNDEKITSSLNFRDKNDVRIWLRYTLEYVNEQFRLLEKHSQNE